MKKYTKRELSNMETIEQAWDGSELKVLGEDFKVWLTPREHRQWDGDYVVEILVDGHWIQEPEIFE